MNHVLTLFFLVALTTGLGAADLAECDPTTCKVEDNCRCSSGDNPIADSSKAPQFIAVTISEAITVPVYFGYLERIFQGRKNPDGSNIGITCFINHEYTDYSLVNKLYNLGYEIGVHSITNNKSKAYWSNATVESLVEEFDGQRQIISTHGLVPLEDIVGARTPLLQIEGDVTFQAYSKSGITYDNSWTTVSTHPLFPYTLDYATDQDCVNIDCPKETHPGLWVAPITDIKGNNNTECNSFSNCEMDSSGGISNWLLSELIRVKSDVREPLVWQLESEWFDAHPQFIEGFTKFLDEVAKQNDVFLVTLSDIIDWTKKPVTASEYKVPDHSKNVTCKAINCNYNLDTNAPRVMGTCASLCPSVYPWKGNPMGLNSAVVIRSSPLICSLFLAFILYVLN